MLSYRCRPSAPVCPQSATFVRATMLRTSANALWSRLVPAASRLPSPEWMPSAGALAMLPEIYYEWLAILWYYARYLR